MPSLSQHFAVQVNGYLRDRAGRWRYESSGRYVPGGRDITLNTLWRFPRTDRGVSVPVAALIARELAWCRPYVSTAGVVTKGRTTAVIIPLADWDDQAALVLGMDAPELAAHRMVDVGRLAAMLGTTRSTVRAYEARGQLPPRTIEGFGGPLWSVAIIVEWLKGRRRDQPSAASRTRTPRVRPTTNRPERARLNMGDVDEVLARIEAGLAAQGIAIDDGDDTADDRDDDAD